MRRVEPDYEIVNEEERRRDYAYRLRIAQNKALIRGVVLFLISFAAFTGLWVWGIFFSQIEWGWETSSRDSAIIWVMIVPTLIWWAICSWQYDEHEDWPMPKVVPSMWMIGGPISLLLLILVKIPDYRRCRCEGD